MRPLAHAELRLEERAGDEMEHLGQIAYGGLSASDSHHGESLGGRGGRVIV